MVQALMERLLAGRSPLTIREQPLRLLEPACGAGAFLLGAYQYLLDWHLQHYLNADIHDWLWQAPEGTWELTIAERQRILLESLYGVDLDPSAVAAAKQALVTRLLQGRSPRDQEPWRSSTLQALNRNIKCGNSVIGTDLEHPDPTLRAFNWQQEFSQIMATGGFDGVIGNPPYIDAETMSLHAAASRRYCARHYQTATGNWDLFCIFVEKAIALCKPGGFTSLIVPNKLASASYATATRQLLAQQNRLLTIHDYSRVPVFSVAVYPIVYLAQKHPPQAGDTVQYRQMSPTTTPPRCIQQQTLDYQRFTQPQHPWTFSGDSPLLDRLQTQFPPLETVATVLGAATVAEAYALQPWIQDLADPTALKLINSGTIDRYWMGWGQRACRYLGHTYLHPVITPEQTQHLPQKRHWQATQPKIVVAGMTRILECVADLSGTVLAAKSTSIILSSLDLRYLLALLNSKLLTFCYQQWFGGDRLQGGYLRIGPRQLRQLPIQVPTPDNQPLLDQLLALVEQRITPSLHTPGLDQQIDQLIYQLYNLTQAEIALVEASA